MFITKDGKHYKIAGANWIFNLGIIKINIDLDEIYPEKWGAEKEINIPVLNLKINLGFRLIAKILFIPLKKVEFTVCLR